MFVFSNIYNLTDMNSFSELVDYYEEELEDAENRSEKEHIILEEYFKTFYGKVINDRSLKLDFKEWLTNEIEDMFVVEYDEEEETYFFNCFLDEVFEEKIDNSEDLMEFTLYYYENI